MGSKKDHWKKEKGQKPVVSWFLLELFKLLIGSDGLSFPSRKASKKKSLQNTGWDSSLQCSLRVEFFHRQSKKHTARHMRWSSALSSLRLDLCQRGAFHLQQAHRGAIALLQVEHRTCPERRFFVGSFAKKKSTKTTCRGPVQRPSCYMIHM